MITTSTVFSWGIATVMGGCMGSFLNVIAYRLPLMLKHREAQWICQQLGTNTTCSVVETLSKSSSFNLFLPASLCPQCKKTLAYYDKIPVFSWLWLTGQCRHCREPIHWHYPLLELLMAGFAGYLTRYYPLGISWLLLIALVGILLVLMVVDLKEQLLPDCLTYSLLWAGLVWHCLYQQEFLPQAILGAIVGYLALWILYWIYKILTQLEGLGYGDFKLLGALGAWFGWRILPEIVMIAVAFTLMLLLIRTLIPTLHHNSTIPFGPGLAIAGLGEFCRYYLV